LILIELALLCASASGQMTAVDWDNKGIELAASGKYDEALQSYNKAIEIDPQDELGWSLKADLLEKLGRTTEANLAYAKIRELEAAGTTNVIDHCMASDVDESTKNVIQRSHDFFVNASKAYSWLSLKNVSGSSTVWWYWFSPAGNMLYQDKVQIPIPTNGDRWSAYNVLSHIDIAGNYPVNLTGDWHADVYLDGDKILTEYFSIQGGEPPMPLENQYPNNFDNWRVWNSKGDALSKQGKYAEAIQAYDKAIELVPDIPLPYGGKGNALRALGRTNESDVAYATARELGDYSAWIPKTNATGINLTGLYFIEILDHCMASDIDKARNDVITRSSTFSSNDSNVYSWLGLGHVLGAKIKWHWYSPDGNPYKIGQVDVPRNPSGGYWSSYNVWYGLDIAEIPTEPYMSGHWHVDIYINGQKRLKEQFAIDIDVDSGKAAVSPSAAPGSSAAYGTITVLDHAMTGEIDEATDSPVKTTKTNEFKDYMIANSWLRLGNIGVARIEWHWHNGGWDIKDTYDIPPNPSGGYWSSYNVWDPLDIPNMVSSFEQGESDAWAAYRSAEREGYWSGQTNSVADPYGDWTVDVYVNDQWLLQEQFKVVSG
jgi:tetratricopeptide (TPR) repeat protein